jgi:hypothetical protein
MRVRMGCLCVHERTSQYDNTCKHNTCKHSGAVLPFPSAPVGRGVDGIDAMA